MIDYLLVVLLFAFVPIGIILLFIGCFYCFLFIQHCATYTDTDDDNRSDDSHNTRRDEGTPTPTPLTVATTTETLGVGGGFGICPSSAPVVRREKRLGADFTLPVALPAESETVINVNVNNIAVTNDPHLSLSEELPPPPYHSICFTNDNLNDKEMSTVEHHTTV